jgi:hypothetical protein
MSQCIGDAARQSQAPVQPAQDATLKVKPPKPAHPTGRAHTGPTSLLRQIGSSGNDPGGALLAAKVAHILAATDILHKVALTTEVETLYNDYVTMAQILNDAPSNTKLADWKRH